MINMTQEIFMDLLKSAQSYETWNSNIEDVIELGYYAFEMFNGDPDLRNCDSDNVFWTWYEIWNTFNIGYHARSKDTFKDLAS